MEIAHASTFPKQVTGILIPFGTDRKLHTALPQEVKEVVEQSIANDLLHDKPGSIHSVTAMSDGHFYDVVMVVLDEKDIDGHSRNPFLHMADGFKKLQDNKALSVACMLDNLPALENNKDLLLKVAQLPELVKYAFDTYLSKPKPRLEKAVFVTKVANFESIQKEATILSQANSHARQLVNIPNIDMSPAIFATNAEKAGKEAGFKVTVLNQADCEALKMDAFLSVNKGSANEAKFIVMEYTGDSSSEKKFGLVGKGLMYDSGGYSLKPSNSMETMLGDMAGSAAVVGTMEAIAKMGLKQNVVAVVAACENRVSGDAYVPGDIIRSMSGQTIEVLNTDAEGRLTLADALTYIITKHAPDIVLDIATLTGAVGVAVGDRSAAILSNNEEAFKVAEASSKLAYENIWRLHLQQEYVHHLESTHADLKNSITSGGPGAGTTTAALFLEKFVEETPWIHLDIASVSWSTNTKYLYPGATGYGVDLMYQIVKNWK